MKITSELAWRDGLVALALCLLASCSSGGGGGGDGSVDTAITGVVADGNGPYSGATVTLKDAAGRTVSSTAASDGSFSFGTRGLIPAFLLSSTRNSQSLYGYSAQIDGVANLNPFTTAVLQAYYLPSGTTVEEEFSGPLSASSVPEGQQVALLAGTIVRALVPFFENAGVSNASVFNPFTTRYVPDGTGFSNVVANTTLAADLLSVTTTAPSGAIAGQSSTMTFSPSGAATGTANPEPDLIKVTMVTFLPEEPAIISVITINTCRTGGVPIPFSVYRDCVVRMEMDPPVVNVAPGGRLGVSINTLVPNDQISPALLAYDAAGNLTTIPLLANILEYTVTGTSISVSKSVGVDNMITGAPIVHALNLGTSQLTLTDPVTNATATLTVNGVPPKLAPDRLVISYPYPFGPDADRVFLVDGANNPVEGPPLLTLDSSPPFDVISHDSLAVSARAGWEIQGIGPGNALLSGTEIFGDLGFQTVTAHVCVQNSTNTACNGTTIDVAADPATLPSGGGAVTLTASVSPSAGPATTPTGTITFVDQAGAVLCNAVAVISGAASCSANVVTVPLTVTADYSGDDTFAGGSSSITIPDAQSCPGLGTGAWQPTTVSGSYSASGAGILSGPVSDSGSFSGSLLFFGPDTWYISSLTLISSLYGSGYYTAPSIPAAPPVIPNPFFGIIGSNAAAACGGATSVSEFEIRVSGSTPGPIGSIDAAFCFVDTWTTGPLAGLPGTSSSGSGTYSEFNGFGTSDIISVSGTCTVTVQ